jgi:NADPH:quinone reductase-like Zn-dependent oxidoreductase
MKAVRYHDYGSPDVLCYEDAPTPEPGPHEVHIRVHAAGVNPADQQIRAGLRFRLDRPFAFTPGCEISGIVEKTGAEVTESRWAIGFMACSADLAVDSSRGGFLRAIDNSVDE